MFDKKFKLNEIVKMPVIRWTSTGFVFHETDFESYQLDCTYASAAYVDVYGRIDNKWRLATHYKVKNWAMYRDNYKKFWINNERGMGSSNEQYSESTL